MWFVRKYIFKDKKKNIVLKLLYILECLIYKLYIMYFYMYVKL